MVSLFNAHLWKEDWKGPLFNIHFKGICRIFSIRKFCAFGKPVSFLLAWNAGHEPMSCFGGSILLAFGSSFIEQNSHITQFFNHRYNMDIIPVIVMYFDNRPYDYIFICYAV